MERGAPLVTCAFRIPTRSHFPNRERRISGTRVYFSTIRSGGQGVLAGDIARSPMVRSHHPRHLPLPAELRREGARDDWRSYAEP